MELKVLAQRKNKSNRFLNNIAKGEWHYRNKNYGKEERDWINLNNIFELFIHKHLEKSYKTHQNKTHQKNKKKKKNKKTKTKTKKKRED